MKGTKRKRETATGVDLESSHLPGRREAFIDELLAEVRPKAKYPSLNKFLHQLRGFLINLPATKEFELCDEASWLPDGTCLPLPKEIIGQATSDCKFRFSPPSSIKVVGSYLLGTATKPTLNVNIAVQLSSELLYASDYVNHRYLHKRAAFLALLAAHLSTWDAVDTTQFARANGNPLLPIIVLKPAGKAGRHFKVNIHPCVEEGFFRMPKLGPQRNCLRFHKLFGGKALEASEEVPTAYYNTAVLRDMLMHRHLQLLHAVVEQCPAMADAVHLFNVWLHQRRLDEGQHSFSGFLASMLVSQLVQARQVMPMMSSYQILRLLFKTIGAGDWTTRGLSLYQGDEDVPKLSDFLAVFEVVFVDHSGYLNLCAHMTTASYLELVHEAQLAMKFLDESALDGFKNLFMTPVETPLKFDQFSHLSNVCPLQRTSTEWQRRTLAHGGDWLAAGLRYMCRVLRKGLGHRVSLLAHRSQATLVWDVGEDVSPLSQTKVSFGFLIDTDNAFAVIDHGPPANSEEALVYRKFWGGKSELRLFQDSSILEAVLWPSTCAAEKRTIIARIVSHLLQRHAQLSVNTPPAFDILLADRHCQSSRDTSLCSMDAALDDGIDIPKHSQKAKQLLAMEKAKQKQKKSSSETLPTGEEEHVTINSLLDELGHKLRKLTELPLSVVSVQGASPVFGNTEVFPCHRALCAKGCKLSPWTPLLEVVCQLESSGKWPDDLAAVSRVKAAFYIRLASLLKERFALTSMPTAKAVFITMNEVIFRLVICRLSRPLHTSHMHSLSQQFAAFGLTCRLAKRWLSSHLFSPHFTAECVELIVAHVFLSPAPFSPPASASCGFLRFLHCLSSWDWDEKPLVVNLDNDIKDQDLSRWTAQTPSPVVLQRACLLAREALSVLKTAVMSSEEDFPEVVFRPSLADYHVLIHLRTHQLPRRYQAIGAPGIEAPADQQRLPVTSFNPVECYLEMLQTAYGHSAMFFYDEYGGNVIGVVWKDLAASSFQVSSISGYKPCAAPRGKRKKLQNDMVQFNVDAALDDFAVFGRGLVKRIETLVST